MSDEETFAVQLEVPYSVLVELLENARRESINYPELWPLLKPEDQAYFRDHAR